MDMHIVSSFSARFQLEIKMPQLGSTRLGKFSARARSSRKIPARTHPITYLTLTNGSSQRDSIIGGPETAIIL